MSKNMEGVITTVGVVINHSAAVVVFPLKKMWDLMGKEVTYALGLSGERGTSSTTIHGLA